MKRKELKKYIVDKDQLFLVMKSLMGVSDAQLAKWSLLEVIEYTNKWCAEAMQRQRLMDAGRGFLKGGPDIYPKCPLDDA